MARRTDRDPEAELRAAARTRQAGAPAGAPSSGHPSAGLSLAELPVAGLTRRRIALALCALVAAWVIVLFARQVGEASEAVARADSMRASNGVLSVRVADLGSELSLVAQQRYVTQQARRYRLGTPGEIPFRLADDAPPLPAGAPGSESTRLGATTEQRSPLETWLDVLFGASAPAG
jgi:cell division protein FtsB